MPMLYSTRTQKMIIRRTNKADEKSSSSEDSFSNEDPEELDEEIKDIKSNKIRSMNSNSGLARVIYLLFHSKITFDVAEQLC